VFLSVFVGLLQSIQHSVKVVFLSAYVSLFRRAFIIRLSSVSQCICWPIPQSIQHSVKVVFLSAYVSLFHRAFIIQINGSFTLSHAHLFTRSPNHMLTNSHAPPFNLSTISHSSIHTLTHLLSPIHLFRYFSSFFC
jgi:hypothetical protein